jgi:hypothetical protein
VALLLCLAAAGASAQTVTRTYHLQFSVATNGICPPTSNSFNNNNFKAAAKTDVEKYLRAQLGRTITTTINNPNDQCKTVFRTVSPSCSALECAGLR